MRPTKFVESYFDAWNHRDPEGVARHLAVDGTYFDVPENVRRTHTELITNLHDFFATYRHRYELVGDILTNGNTVAFQYEMVPPGNGRRPASRATYRGAEFVTLGDSEALSIVDYCNISGSTGPATIVGQSEEAAQQRKYAKSGLSDEQLLAYRACLEARMTEQELFLLPDLTLPRLAEIVDCSVNHLSQVINAGLGMSFFDFLNSHRIEYAKQLLADRDECMPVLNIAYAVGFNSNSAFYAAFKKYVGLTPAQYRKLRLSKPN